MFWTIIGFSAASLTMFAFIPQIIRVVRNHSAKDLSPVMLLQYIIGVLLWIAYGLHLRNIVIIIANIITLITLIILAGLFINYGRRKK